MKRISLPLLLLNVCIIAGCGRTSTEDTVTFVSVDPLEKIFRETAFFNSAPAAANAARGEHATFQFALRSSLPLTNVTVEVTDPLNETLSLPVEYTGLVKYVHVGRTTPNPARDRYIPISGWYPDPIVEADRFDLRADETQPVWISVRVPADAQKGSYSGKISIKGKIGRKNFNLEDTIRVVVYPVDLTETTLKVTNWFFTSRLDLMNSGQKVEPLSERYWQLVDTIARTFTAYRQNVAWINPLQLVKSEIVDGTWRFDFTDFNRMASLLMATGKIKLLEGTHLASRETNWDSRFVMHLPVTRDSVAKLPVTEPRVRQFYNSFLPALKKNLEENNWADIYVQHIADEPIQSNLKTYVEIAAFVKGIWPEVKVIEACHASNLKGSIDIWVPQMDYLDTDMKFYKERQDAGEEVWFYTCLAPQGEYANRFIEQPLIKTRLLHWVNYRYGITGYLHWGLNAWSDDPWGETTGIITESGNILPGGDCWIVYPGEGRLYPSIRLEAMRDGIADYELLRQYGQKYPEEAAETARLAVYNFQRYDTDIRSFRIKRKMMLEALSK